MTEEAMRRARWHVGLQPGRIYRDAIRELRGVEIDELAAIRELTDALREARPIVTDLEPEVWTVTVDERRLRITARIIRWEAHALVVAVSPRPVELPTLGEASWTRAALEEYADSRGAQLRLAEWELRAAIWDAKPVDLEVQPERWRYRSGVDRIDVAILSNRVDARGTRLVIRASARPINAGGKPRRRR